MKTPFDWLTFICFCVLLLTLVMIPIDLIVLTLVIDRQGYIGLCQWQPEILPTFNCIASSSPVEQIMGALLNLPLMLFVYAPLLTFNVSSPLPPAFRALLYGLDVVLVLALLHAGRLIVRATRRKAR